MKTLTRPYTGLLAGLLISVSTPTFADDSTMQMGQTVTNAVNEIQKEMQQGTTDMAETVSEMKSQTKQLAEDAADDASAAPKAPTQVDTPKQATSPEVTKETTTLGDKAEEPAKLVGAESPEGAQLRIISPKDGEEVSSPITIVFGLKGMGVAPAGVDKKHTGHHHLIIDGGDELPAAGVPMGKNVKHFGGGQTEAEIELEKGEHTLQLVLGDMLHIPHNPPVISEKITITVK